MELSVSLDRAPAAPSLPSDPAGAPTPASSPGWGPQPHPAPSLPSDPAGAPTPASIPAWAEDAVLDQAFESWIPGPPPEAPDAEWDAVGLVSPPREPDDGAHVPSPVASAGPSRWMRSDDDVLPPRRGSRWGRAAGWRRHA